VRRIILCPYRDAPTFETSESWRPFLKNGWGLITMESSACISMSRSELIHEALEKGADEVLFWDADISLEDPELGMHVFNNKAHSILGAACSRRCFAETNVNFLQQAKQVSWGPAGGPMHVYSVGTGLIGISRAVFEKMGPTLPNVAYKQHKAMKPWYITLVLHHKDWDASRFPQPIQWPDGVWLSEDLSFCHRAHALGFRVFIDTRLRTRHKGSHMYTIEDGFGKAPERYQYLDMSLEIPPEGT